MALDGTYDGLKASVADFLNRGDLTSVVPDFIALAEPQITRVLLKDGPVRQMLGRSDTTITEEYTALPSDFGGIRAVYISGTYAPLEFIEPEKLIERKVLYQQQQGSQPTHFSIVGSELQLSPLTDGDSWGVELTYWKNIPALSATASSNWLLQYHPDIYLYTSLIQSAPYLKDDARITTWSALAATAIADLVAADKVSRFAPQMGMPQHIYGAP